MSEQLLHIRIAIRRSDLRDKTIDVNRLQRRVDRIIAAIRATIRPILEIFADEILAMARSNAATYYEHGGAQFTGNQPATFNPRHPATEELYAASPYHTATPGLSAGYDRIIESLFPGGLDNIIDFDEDSVEVGTENHLAKLIEEGGLRPPKRHVGQGRKKSYLPWENILRSYGIDPDGPIDIPPRPYLKPALWHLRDEEDGKFLYGLMTEIIKRIVEKIPGIEVEA